MDCPKCGAPLPPEAETCPACGTALAYETTPDAPAARDSRNPARRRKALHGVIAGVAAVLVIAGILLWYFVTTDRETNNEIKDAINDMRFSDAEAQMENVHLFQPGDLELRRALIAAGHASEARDNVALLQQLARVRETYDATALAPYRGVIDKLEATAEPDLYVSLCTDYEAGAYEDVLDGFETLAARGYERSRDYLFLVHAHLARDLPDLAKRAELTEDEAEQRLMRLIGFADANKVVFSNDSYAAPYLQGFWESVDGTMSVDGNRATCNLPGIEPDELCTVRDGAIYKEEDPTVPVYTLEVFNANTLICDRVEDGVNCTLRKQG